MNIIGERKKKENQAYKTAKAPYQKQTPANAHKSPIFPS
jgi:hypothetical protein